MDIKPGVPFASISWWTLKISWCLLGRVGEVSPAPWSNSKFLPEAAKGIALAAQPRPQPMIVPQSFAA